MSAVAKFASPLVSMIPGVGGIAGAALGALGSSGKQAGMNSTQNSTTTQNVNQLNEAIEPDYFKSFREGLIPMFAGELDKAMNTQVYGDAQKAGFLQDTNDAAMSSMEGAKAALARAGRLDSGSMDDIAGNIAMKQAGDQSQFFADLPFKEQEARFAKVMPLLQLGAGWAGQAPVSQKMTGTNTSNTTGSMQQTQQGPGFMQSFTSGLAGMMGRGGYQPMFSGSGAGMGMAAPSYNNMQYLPGSQYGGR